MSNRPMIHPVSINASCELVLPIEPLVIEVVLLCATVSRCCLLFRSPTIDQSCTEHRLESVNIKNSNSNGMQVGAEKCIVAVE